MFSNQQFKRIARINLFLLGIFALQIALGYVFIRQVLISKVISAEDTLVNRVQSDINYTNGQWNITAYTDDPSTPNPTGASGFTDPLYIITADGFVIERNQPINGFLDSSDLKHILTYQTPQTVKAATNETWRVLSHPIIAAGKTIGAIMVSNYNPEPAALTAIDTKLQDNINTINSQISIKNNQINTKQLDKRSLSYDISYEIVDIFNKVLVNDGRTPSYIDPSYLTTIIHSRKQQIITDTNSADKFMVVTVPITDKNQNSVGVIATGKSISSLYDFTNNYLIYTIITAITLSIPLSIIISITLNKMLMIVIRKDLTQLPQTISFNKPEGCLIINGVDKVTIPTESNQFYLCQIIFSQPDKLWTEHELLKALKQKNNKITWRQIYDSMVAINKRLPFKLINYDKKIYQINPDIVSK